MDGGVTRSLYIGRDKTGEVLKRREAVERELQAKREAKIREQYERLERAAQQKETEMRERMQQRHLREFERQKAVLDRRCAQMEQLNARKTELLKRAHQSSSRIATLNQSKKPIYAFGSSTPRNLAFLENPQQRDSGPRNSPIGMRGSTPLLSQGSSNLVPTTSRFHNPPSLDGKVGPSEMTRSVFGALGNGIGTTPNRQINVKKPPVQPTKQTPNAIKKQRKLANDGMLKANGGILNNASMTQSLYAQGTSRVTMAQGKINANIQKAPIAKQTPTKRLPPSVKATPKPNVSTGTKGVLIVQKSKFVAEKRPPPIIRPNKSQQQKPNQTVPVKENEIIVVAKAEEILIPEQLKQETLTFIVPGQDKEEIVDNREEKERSATPADSSEEQPTLVDTKEGEETIDFVEETIFVAKGDESVENVNDESAVVDEPVENMPDQRLGPSLFDELTGKEIHHDIDGDQLIGFEQHQEKQNSHSNDATLTATNASFYTALESSSMDEVSMLEHVPLPETEPIITPPKSTTPPVLIVIPNQEETEERRRQLKELLARTRQDATGPPNVASNGTSNLNNGGSSVSSAPSMPIAASNPLLPQRDASALVQDINAKFRHKFLKQQQKDSEMAVTSQVNPPTEQLASNLTKELAESGISINHNAEKETFCLPGQVISATNQFHATSLTIFSKNVEERDDHILLKQHPSPPDDPMTNGHKINEEFHPPEPTTKAQIS